MEALLELLVEVGRVLFGGVPWSVVAKRFVLQMSFFVSLPLGSFGVCVSFSVSYWLWFEFIIIHKLRCR